MYEWRKKTDKERVETIKVRKQRKLPWHSPPHFNGEGLYHLTAAVYEHKKIINKDYKRISDFSNELLSLLSDMGEVKSWCVLPNHYHILISLKDLKSVTKELGKLHGRTSYKWNKEENLQGRQCWCKVSDRKIRSDKHHYATLNYIHHNPVKHGYVKKWDEWDFSSAKQYLEEVGRDQALKIWSQYPLFNYGDKWDIY